MNAPIPLVVGALVWLAGLGMGAKLSTTVDDATLAQLQREVQRIERSAVPGTAQAGSEPTRSPEQQRAHEYWQALRADARTFGVGVPRRKAWLAPQSYRNWLRKTKTIKPGRSMRKGPLELTAKLQNLRFMRQGAMLKSQHTVLTLRNRGARPVAYRVAYRAVRRGQCQVRGTVQHNAVALMPGERADISVCAGKTPVELAQLETLAISPLGYHYLSQLPPQALGVEDTQASAHHVPGSRPLCSRVASGKLQMALEGRALKWRDVADFFSRHACTRYTFPDNYKRSKRSLRALPVSSAG